MRTTCLALLASLTMAAYRAPSQTAAANAYTRWTRGPSTNADFFPLAVWLQSPGNAERYRKAGFNTYVGLWNGPTAKQLEVLRAAGMHVVCEQNEYGRESLNDPVIIGWMHGDEPDNAQELPNKEGWGPPILPEKIVDSYRRLRSVDPSRPVMLNLGQGVAWDEWYGRGSRKNHPEDYPKYIEGSDIVSFDIYPAVHDNKAIAGHLDYVGRGVDRLIEWTKGHQIVWNCIECTHISNPDRKPTPHEVRAEAWMSLIHGSRGLIYFVHQFKPSFREAGLLDDREMLSAVTGLNRQITQLARILNSPTLRDGVSVKPDGAPGNIATMMKREGEFSYLFTVEMQGQGASIEFKVPGSRGKGEAVVLGEDRSVETHNGGFRDHFEPWDVHLYRLRNQPAD